MLGVFFGVSDQSISNYVDEVALKVHEKFVPRLFFLPTPEEVRPYVPPEVARLFPDALLIGDATHFLLISNQVLAERTHVLCVQVGYNSANRPV